MPSFSNLKSDSAKIAKRTDNDDIRELAEIVRYLAKQCQDLEADVKRANKRADRAMRQ